MLRNGLAEVENHIEVSLIETSVEAFVLRRVGAAECNAFFLQILCAVVGKTGSEVDPRSDFINRRCVAEEVITRVVREVFVTREIRVLRVNRAILIEWCFGVAPVPGYILAVSEIGCFLVEQVHVGLEPLAELLVRVFTIITCSVTADPFHLRVVRIGGDRQLLGQVE